MDKKRNRLKELRRNAHITLMKEGEYVNESCQNISRLENENRALRQVHIYKFSQFFNVTNDYLLGESDVGFKVTSNDGSKTYILSEEEYNKAFNNNYIEQDIVDIRNTIQFAKDKTYFINAVVFRRFTEGADPKMIKSANETSLNDLIAKLSERDIEKVRKFIEDYIL